MKDKKFSVLFLIFLAVVFVGAIILFSQPPALEKPLAFKEISIPSDVSEIHLDKETKIVVPNEIEEDVWSHLYARLCENNTALKNIDAALNSSCEEEFFSDTYFDTPDLAMARRFSSIRHRSAENYTNISGPKNDLDFLQIDSNNANSDVPPLAEIKYDIKVNVKKSDPESMLPVLGLLSKKDRVKLNETLGEININPFQLRKIMDIKIHRRSIKISYNGKQIISERLDEITSNMWWISFNQFELEHELTKVPDTEEGKAKWEFISKVNNLLINDLLENFSSVKMDSTPQYNKALNYFIEKMPVLRFLIYNNLL